MTNSITQKTHLFEFKENNYVYVSGSNNIYAISKEGANFIKDGEGNKSVKKELYSILINRISANTRKDHSLHIKVHETNKLNFTEIVKQLSLDMSFAVKTFFLEINESRKHIEDILVLNKSVRDKGYNLVIVDDLDNLYIKEDIALLKEHKLRVSYYTSLDGLKKIVENKVNIKGVLELRLNNIAEAKEVFEKMKTPFNLGLCFSTKDSKTAKYLFSRFSEIIDKILKSETKTHCINLSSLFKINIGKLIPKNDFTYISDDGALIKNKDCAKCNDCWAKQNCWNSKIYTVFSPHPYLTSMNQNNCDLIRDINEEIIKAFLMVQESNKIKAPIKILSKNFTLNFLNP